MMKKILFCMMTLAVMAAGSCSRQEEAAFQGEPSEINRLAVRATLGDDGGTKTVRICADGPVFRQGEIVW